MSVGRIATAIAALAAFSCAATAQAATVTVGSPLTQSFTPTTIFGVGTVINSALPEPGANVASPISGTVVRWRITGAEGGPFKLRVLRPAGIPFYTGAGTSAPEIPTSTSTQVFSTNLPIQAGDLIGFDNSNEKVDKIGTISPLAGAQFTVWAPPLSDGSTIGATEITPNREIGINADVQPPPTIGSIKPKGGSIKGGTKVKITGTDLTGATSVSFGHIAAKSFTPESETQVTAIAPAAKDPGGVDVTVTTAAGTTPPVASDRFAYEACKVPKLLGKSLKKAKKRLKKAHCKLGKVKRTGGATATSGKVVKQKPKSGKLKAPGAKVKVTLG
jgi:hypothetical protein